MLVTCVGLGAVVSKVCLCADLGRKEGTRGGSYSAGSGGMDWTAVLAF